jgi:hypothetical protein
MIYFKVDKRKNKIDYNGEQSVGVFGFEERYGIHLQIVYNLLALVGLIMRKVFLV